MNIDTAHSDRQEIINNLSGSPVEREAPLDSGAPAQFSSDTWEAIEAQLDYWAQMDAAYWQQRKEKAYAAWMERTYGV